jgi:hypothetical protein
VVSMAEMCMASERLLATRLECCCASVQLDRAHGQTKAQVLGEPLPIVLRG